MMLSSSVLGLPNHADSFPLVAALDFAHQRRAVLIPLRILFSFSLWRGYHRDLSCHTTATRNGLLAVNPVGTTRPHRAAPVRLLSLDARQWHYVNIPGQARAPRYLARKPRHSGINLRVRVLQPEQGHCRSSPVPNPGRKLLLFGPKPTPAPVWGFGTKIWS